MAEDDLTINVWVGNLGRYNEGTLIGGWLRLPVDEQRIDRFLTEQVGLTLDAQQAYEIGRQGGVVYEEYGILDYEYDGLLAAPDYRPGEYEDRSLKPPGSSRRTGPRHWRRCAWRPT